MGNDSVICVTGGKRGTRVICQFFCQFRNRPGKRPKSIVLVSPDFASFGAICQF
nr:MAG TPA: hypothetical protein [Caudoviricetes sp.]